MSENNTELLIKLIVKIILQLIGAVILWHLVVENSKFYVRRQIQPRSERLIINT